VGSPASEVIGTAYLIHFSRRWRHNGHYIGWTSKPLAERIEAHRRGNGAKLMRIIRREGIDWEVARTWPDVTVFREKQLKRKGGASRMCPLCGIHPQAHSHPRALP
jgi:predicted GIY-YIG superfamily endonuclease